MTADPSSYIRACVALMLEPLVDFCVARGVRIQDFLEITKGCFVRAAERKLGTEGRQASASRVCIMTGIQRPEIARFRSKDFTPRTKDFITRVVGQWSGDSRFLDRKQRPRPLTTEGTKSEFALLVHTVSKDLNPHTVRFEMERTGIITQEDGKATLQKAGNIVSGDPLHTLKFIGEDARDLIVAVQENAVSGNLIPNLHARTQYDNISDEDLEKIRAWLLELGNRVHEETRSYLSRFDRDINHDLARSGGRHRVVLGTFSRIEQLPDDEKEDEHDV